MSGSMGAVTMRPREEDDLGKTDLMRMSSVTAGVQSVHSASGWNKSVALS